MLQNVSAWLTQQFTAYGAGWCARMHLAILFHWNFIPTKKIREMAYVSIGVHPQGNQEHPIMEVTDSKKAGDIVGGVKDNSASLDVDSTI